MRRSARPVTPSSDPNRMPKGKTGSRAGFTPVNFVVKLAAVSAVALVAGLAFLRWVFWRDLGMEYSQSFYTLKSMSDYLVPTLLLSLLLVLLIASLALMAVAVVASHKLAGPLFRLQRVAGDMDKLILEDGITLRERDWFKGVAERMNRWTSERKSAHSVATNWARDAEASLRHMKLAAGKGDYGLARIILKDMIASLESRPDKR